MSLEPTDEQHHHGSADTKAKRPHVALELKKLSPKAVLEWLESQSSSSDRATSEQIEELKQYVRALIPEENGVNRRGSWFKTEKEKARTGWSGPIGEITVPRGAGRGQTVYLPGLFVSRFHRTAPSNRGACAKAPRETCFYLS